MRVLSGSGGGLEREKGRLMSDVNDNPNGARTWALLTTIGLLSRVVLDAAVLALTFYATWVVPDWVLRTKHGDPTATIFAAAYACGVVLSLLAGIFTAVAFLIWLFRAVRTAHARGLRPRSSPAGAVAVWFIPFVNLVVPYHVLRSLHRVSTRNDPRARHDPLTRWPQIFVAWWFGWLGMIVLNRVSSSNWWSDTPVLTVSWADTAEVICVAIAASGAAIIVWSIQRAQSAFVAEPAVPQFVPPVGVVGADDDEAEDDDDDDEPGT